MWNWHSLTDCTQNNLSRSPGQQCQTMSHTAAVWNQSRCPSASLQAAAVNKELQFDFIWFKDEKCLPSNHHSTCRMIGFMHHLITRSDTSVPADCYACRLWRPLPCHKWVWLKWYLSTMGWRWTAKYYCDVLLSQQMLSAIKRVAERCLFT